MPIKIIYLDDEEALCKIFSQYYGSDQVNIKTFVDANEAIKFCQVNPPDLFFIDYRLSGITGDDVAFAVEESIPKILVTGDISFTSKYNFHQVISKPFDFNKVQKLINHYL